MCYPVSGMVHIKEPLLLIRKSSPCGGSRFPLSLSEWSFIICLIPYNSKYKRTLAANQKGACGILFVGFVHIKEPLLLKKDTCGILSGICTYKRSLAANQKE